MPSPFDVARMLEIMKIQPHHRILEIGTGSGYTTAILARMAQDIVSLERFQSLSVEAKSRLAQLELGHVALHWADGLALKPNFGIFDRILVHGRLDIIPAPILGALADQGILVLARAVQGEPLPVLMRFMRDGTRQLSQSHYGNIRAMPLIAGLSQGLALALLSGCSSDVTRITNPFGSPAFAADETPTGALPPESINSHVASSKSRAVSSKPLAAPAVSSHSLKGLAVPASPSPQLSHNRKVQEPVTTASVVRHPVSSQSGWSAAGGTPIVVATGESSKMLALRYGIPENVLLSVNGFSNAAQVQPGARMVIPVYNSAGAQSAANTAPVAAAVPATPHAGTKMKFVAGPQPVTAPASQQATAARVNHAKAVNIAKAQPVAIDAAHKPTKLANNAGKVPVMEAVNVRPMPRPGTVPHIKPVEVAAVVAAPAKPTLAAAKPATMAVDTTPTASLVAKPAAEPSPAAVTTADAAAPEFRWPARGRVIQGFKSGGNDGINIAVPEGTSVKAAEGGVVAYAGSELKGYGNLVLIRHPNGFVSAYANNAELIVKRGEQVKRGQIIAKSGQTGNVTSPQLHFELRKGSTPVDPTNYLAGL
eukprot:gene6336-6407_t